MCYACVEMWVFGVLRLRNCLNCLLLCYCLFAVSKKLHTRCTLFYEIKINLLYALKIMYFNDSHVQILGVTVNLRPFSGKGRPADFVLAVTAVTPSRLPPPPNR